MENVTFLFFILFVNCNEEVKVGLSSCCFKQFTAVFLRLLKVVGFYSKSSIFEIQTLEGLFHCNLIRLV